MTHVLKCIIKMFISEASLACRNPKQVLGGVLFSWDWTYFLKNKGKHILGFWFNHRFWRKLLGLHMNNVMINCKRK